MQKLNKVNITSVPYSSGWQPLIVRGIILMIGNKILFLLPILIQPFKNHYSGLRNFTLRIGWSKKSITLPAAALESEYGQQRIQTATLLRLVLKG